MWTAVEETNRGAVMNITKLVVEIRPVGTNMVTRSQLVF